MSDDLWPEPAAAAEAPTAEPAPTPTVKDRFVEVMRLEGLATAATAAARALRDELDTEARDEYARTAAAPTWRMSDLGTATLPITKEAVAVADINALLAWTRERHPEQIRTVEEVEPAFQSWLIANCVRADGAAVHPETGEVVPGLTVRPGGVPRSLSWRPEPATRVLFVQYGEALLAELLARGGQ